MVKTGTIWAVPNQVIHCLWQASLKIHTFSLEKTSHQDTYFNIKTSDLL